MQYFKPEGLFFAGDPMPFFHEGVFHLFWLLDENHHQGKGGLGGHQWAHSSSRDLIHWEQHPLALAIDEEWEGSICTGSVFHHDDTFYAFYATRKLDWTQHLGRAVSQDGVTFQKTMPNPFASPAPGYAPLHYRDPFVFQDEQTGQFHMLVTALLEQHRPSGYGGCLAHLVSTDLRTWQLHEPFLIPGYSDVPECSDYFHWNGWYYLIFSNGGVARYRMSRQPFGPWLRPKVDTFDSSAARVMKTAAFTGDRRIGVAFLGTREGDKDHGKRQWAGNLVFRELVQHADGTLGSKFPAEMVPTTDAPRASAFTALTAGVTLQTNQVHLAAPEGLAVAEWSGLPSNGSLRLRVTPQPGSGAFGLRLRGSGDFAQGYDLRFLPAEQKVDLHDLSIYAVDGIDRVFTLEIILNRDIIDVCIDGRRCLINRCPELRGTQIFLFCQHGAVTFEHLL